MVDGSGLTATVGPPREAAVIGLLPSVRLPFRLGRPDVCSLNRPPPDAPGESPCFGWPLATPPPAPGTAAEPLAFSALRAPEPFAASRPAPNEPTFAAPR